jgi:2-octaprenyl-6-methoxyphenol hydroxylase
MQQQNYDLAIVGGGLAGMILACSLRHLPINIALIEARQPPAKPSTNFDTRSIALAQTSVNILSALDIWPTLAQDATPIKKVHVSQQGTFGRVLLDATDYQQNAFGQVVPISILASNLLQIISTQKNIDFICPAQVTQFSIEASQATLSLQSQEQTRSLTCQLLVGADGSHSALAELAALPNKVYASGESAIVCNLQLQGEHHHVAYERFTPQGIIAMLPIAANTCTAILTCPTAELAALTQLSDAAYVALLQRQFGYRLGRFIHGGKRQHYPLQTALLTEQVKPRLVILGNAAHTLHPVAAQGFNLSLRDVAWLSELLAQAIENGQDIGSQRLLTQYQQQCRPDQQRMLDATRFLTHIFQVNCWPLRLARGMGLFALDILGKKIVANWGMGKYAKANRLTVGIT